MRRPIAVIVSIVLAFAAMPAVSWAQPVSLSTGAMTQDAEPRERVSVDVGDINDVLLNPGKGWWHLGGNMVDWDYPVLIKDAATVEPLNEAEAAKEARAGTDKWFIGTTEGPEGKVPVKWPDYSGILNLGYFRFGWADIEPAPGEFRWDIIEQQIKPYADAGKKYAFGIGSFSSLSESASGTPQWVFDKGARYVECKNEGQTGFSRTSIVPVWNDPVYLEYQKRLINALAEKYDGDPRIAFIDIRGYGNYGEQHLNRISDDPEYLKTYTLSAEEFERCYIKPFQDAFEKTLIVTPYGNKDYLDVYKRAIENGMSIRRDGILGADSWLNPDGSVRFWTDGWETALADDKQPAIFELALDGTYTDLLERNPDQWSTKQFTKSVETGKPSYIQMPYDMYRDNKAYCDLLANKMGYWMRLEHAEYDASMKAGVEADVTLTFRNDGVASMFEPNASYLALLDVDGNAVSRCKTDWNASNWKAGTSRAESFAARFDGVMPGTYRLAYGMFADEGDAAPTYLLGSAGATEDRWYVIGDVTIEAGKAYASVAEMAADESLGTGNVVSTSAYRTGGPATGGATYVIERHDDWSRFSADNGMRVPLANGLWAVLKVADGTVDVRQFGAEGDGVSDDSRCIQAALDAGVATVRAGAGTYALATPVSLRSETHLAGSGAGECLFTRAGESAATELFRCAGDVHGARLSDVGFELSGLDGVRALAVDEGARGVTFHTSQAVPVSFEADPNANDVVVNALMDVEFASRGTQGAGLLDGDAHMATAFNVTWGDASGGRWSRMLPCADGFQRSVSMQVKDGCVAVLASDASGEPGSIKWAEERTVEAGGTMTTTLACQDGIWHELAGGTYADVAAMRMDSSLEPGMRAVTLAYRAGGPSSGGGEYAIECHEDWDSSRDDGGARIMLGNGSWAVLDVSAGEVDVRQFGAYGDGVNDDTAALNNALALAKGCGKASSPFTVHLGAGDFLVTERVVVGSNTVLSGTSMDAARIAAGGNWLRTNLPEGEKADAAVVFLEKVSNVRLEGVFIDACIDIAGFEAELAAKGEKLWMGTSQWKSAGHPDYNALDIRRCADVSVKECRIGNSIATGAEVVDCKGLVFDACTFANLGEGISMPWTHAASSSDWPTGLPGLVIRGCTFDGYTLSEAIVFRAPGVPFADITIEGNRILNKTRGAGIRLGRDSSTSTFSNVRVLNNVVQDCERGIEVHNATSGVIVSGNQLSGGAGAMRLCASEGVIAESNSVRACAGFALSLEDCRSCDVSGLSVTDIADGVETVVATSGNGRQTKVAGMIALDDTREFESAIEDAGEGYDLTGLIRKQPNAGEADPAPGEDVSDEGEGASNEQPKTEGAANEQPKTEGASSGQPKTEGASGGQRKAEGAANEQREAEPSPSDRPAPTSSPQVNEPSQKTPSEELKVRAVYRLLNPKTGERLYLTSYAKAKRLAKGKWRLERKAFMAPVKSSKPVYRLVNKKTGRNLYTTRKTKSGWKNKGIAFYAMPKGGVKVYRLKHAKTGAYVLAKGAEAKKLKKKGYRSMKLAFRAAR